MQRNMINTQKLVMLAILTGIVIILQSLAALLPIYPFTLALALVPIVIGAALIGVTASAWLGFIFAFVILISSPDVALFLAYNPPATIFLILARGALAGVSAGFAYKLIAGRNKLAAVLSAALICPVMNTGVLVAGVYLFFLPLLETWGIDAASAVSFVFVSMVGINFIFETAVNLVFSPVIVRLIEHRQSIKPD